MWRVVRKRFFEELTEHRALVQRLLLVLQCWDEAARIEIEQRFWFVVRVYFYVLVLDSFFFERDPDALYEGAEPARI